MIFCAPELYILLYSSEECWYFYFSRQLHWLYWKWKCSFWGSDSNSSEGFVFFSFCLFVFYPCCFESAWCMHHSRFTLSRRQVYHRTLGLFTILPFSYTKFAPYSSATLNSGPSWQRKCVFYSTSAYSLIKIHKTENSYHVSPFF